MLFGIFFFFGIIMSTSASAAMISYFLDRNNAGLPDGNYLKVTISDSKSFDNAIDFEVEVLTGAFPLDGSNFGMDKFFFNFDRTFDLDLNNIEFITPDDWAIKGDKRAAGFGGFDFRLAGGGNSRTTDLIFSIVGVDRDTIWSYAVGNEFGLLFAAHVGDFDYESDSGFFAGNTVVPIPPSVLLFSSGIIGLIAIRRKFKS
jgi:hypothetical protein